MPTLHQHQAPSSAVDVSILRPSAGIRRLAAILLGGVCLLGVACGAGQDVEPSAPAPAAPQHGDAMADDATEDAFLGRVRTHFPDMLVEGPPSVVEQEYQLVFNAVEALQDWYDNSTNQTDETLQAVMEEAGFASFEALDIAAGRLADVLEFRGRLLTLDHYLQYPPVTAVLVHGEDDDSAPAFVDRLPELRDSIATIRTWVDQRGYTIGDIEHVDQHEVAIRNLNRMHSALYQVRGIRQMR